MTQLYEHGAANDMSVSPDVTDEPGAVVPDAAETAVEPVVRAATLEDVDALAYVEVASYRDVYGTEPSEDVVDGVRRKYRERVELLGELVAVLEKPGIGVYGMIVSVTTDLERDDFLSGEHDMTDNDTIRESYNPEGKNAYVVNLAVLPEERGDDASTLLFLDAFAKADARGIRKAWFTSRLPRFEAYQEQRVVESEVEDPVLSVREMAEDYWRDTDDYGRPRDPLMRFYASLGAEPLALIEEAWKPDKPSNGFGVLFEYDFHRPEEPTSEAVTTTEPITDAAAQLVGAGESQETQIEELVSYEGKPVMKFLRGTVEWAKKHKLKAALLGSAIAGLTYVAAKGGESQIISEIGSNAEWAAPSYFSSLGLYFGGGAVMLGVAGKKLGRNVMGINSELPNLVRSRETKWLKAGFYMNALGGVAAGVVASAAIIRSLPPEAWSTLTIPAADLYSTLVSRALLARAMSGRSAEGQETV